MRLLLDTHAVLWFLAGDEALALPVRQAAADPANEAWVSLVSLWELTIKFRRGRLPFHPDIVAEGATAAGFRWLGIAPRHLETLAGLPEHADHRDPFDHLLIAQAMAEDLTFVTADRFAPRYPVRVLAARG